MVDEKVSPFVCIWQLLARVIESQWTLKYYASVEPTATVETRGFRYCEVMVSSIQLLQVDVLNITIKRTSCFQLSHLIPQTIKCLRFKALVNW